MGDFDKDKLDELCSKIDLLEYASETMEFEPKGPDSYAAHCPRHIDKTPSLLITPSKNLFHCFSCGCGGNIISWMMTFEKLSFNDAVDKIGKIAGVDIKNLKQCSALKVYKDIYRATTHSIKQNTVSRIFLSESEFDKYIDEPPEEWIREGIKPEIMKKYRVRIDDAYNRIVYPVYDSEFRLIGFKGRTRYENWKALGIKSKYINYQKIGTCDYFQGMKENHESIKAHNQVIIFEGIKSVMKLDGWGVDYGVASETSFLNDEQVLILIKMGIRDVTIAFDSDVTMKKILECTKKLRKYTNVYVVTDRPRRDERLLTGEKMSPVDAGQEVWETLYRERRKI